MIEQITQKDFKRLQRSAELMPGKKLGYLIFLGKDGKYYKTSEGGRIGGREMVKWQQRLKTQLDSQTSLL